MSAVPSSPRFDEDNGSPSPSSRARTNMRLPDLATLDSPDSAETVPVLEYGSKQHQAWRHTLGICLLMLTVFLWTASNFLASTIFADNSYSKPFFVTYLNSSFFIIPFVIHLIRLSRNNSDELHAFLHSVRHTLSPRSPNPSTPEADRLLKPDDEPDVDESQPTPSRPLLINDPLSNSHTTLLPPPSSSEPKLSLVATARLSLEFSLLWFCANYFVAACLEYTSVASSTILTSTSSVFTLLFGACAHVERFSWPKLAGVAASLAGVICISSVDGSGAADDHRGAFPHKSRAQLLTGDALALASAVLYGAYAVVMKLRIQSESRVHMALFFGFVGVFNTLLLWPGFILLHVTGVEPFALPPTRRIASIVLFNSLSSLVADFAWAYAMLLTSPLVVTVGLSLTIPLSLVGQMLLNHQSATPWYWVGAIVVVGSFWIVNREAGQEEKRKNAVGRGAGEV